jgi:flagellar hook-associated protein 1 FlgK
MSLTQALTTSLAGLNATQAGLSLVAGNVANAQTPGYVRETAQLVASGTGTAGSSVRVAAVNRVLDEFVQSQLRTEQAGGGYADVRSNLFNQLQGVYGTPGSSSTLENAFNGFTSALQALTTSPDDRTAQIAVVNAAQALTQRLNATSSGIQSLRSEAEQAIGTDVSQANNALQQIANLNQRISAAPLNDSSTAALADQRDQYIDQLSRMMDIRVVKSDNNQVSLFTVSGMQLVGSQAGTLSFDAQGTMTPQAQWSADPSKRSVGTITLTTPNGAKLDMLTSNALRSGEIAGYLNMRDSVLTQAQGQLDAFAAAISSALSDTSTAGTPVTSGANTGFDVDAGTLAPNDSIDVAYVDPATGATRRMSFVAVSDPAAAGPTHDPNVFGIDITGGPASIDAQMNSAFAGTGINVTSPGGSIVRVLANPATAQLSAAGVTTTEGTLTGGVALPLFTDGTAPYTGADGASGPQIQGLAARLVVNPGLVADPSKLVTYQPGMATGDSTRPNFMYGQMTGASLAFSPLTGIGSPTAPFSGTAGTYLSQMLSVQAETASNASQLAQGQDVVVNALQQRFTDGSAVNIDQEMADLLNLQNAYGANARVMTAVRDMLQALLQLT